MNENTKTRFGGPEDPREGLEARVAPGIPYGKLYKGGEGGAAPVETVPAGEMPSTGSPAASPLCGGDSNFADFVTQEEAQSVRVAGHSDPNYLDGEGSAA